MFVEIVLIAVAVCLSVVRYRRSRFHELANKVPTCKNQVPFIGHLHNFVGTTENIMSSLKSYCYQAMQYDNGITKFWLGPKLYFMTVDAMDIEHILKTCIEKDDSVRFLRDVIGDGLVMAPKETWKKRRKVITPAFNIKNMDPFIEVFSQQGTILADQLAKEAGKGTFNAWRYVTAYNLDTVAENAIGHKFYAQTTPDAPIIDALDVCIQVMSQRFFQPWLHPYWLFKLSPVYENYNKSKLYLHDIIDQIVVAFVETKREEDEESDSEIGYDGSRPRRLVTLLESFKTQSVKYGGYSPLEMREEVIAMSAAALDTTSLTMCFTLVMLGRHLDVQEKVHQELDDIWGESDRALVKEDLPKLVYLEKVIKETLRLYPVGAITARKVEQDLLLPSGVTLPGGSQVLTGFWGMHRHPKYWGENVNEFDPERFSPERYNPNPNAFMPFSSGPRNCIGYQYAMMSMKAALSTVLRRFRVSVSGDNLTLPTIPVKIDVTMKAAIPYYIQIHNRS